MFGVKGPKAILSSAIATALAEYFVVDAKTIAANLLEDTKIVLHKVLLRKQVARLPMNSAGTPTLITVTGSVQEVLFTWKWAVGSNKDENNLDAWVRDSALALKGLEFKAKLEYGTGKEELTLSSQAPEKNISIDSNQAAAIHKQGGFQAWIGEQVRMIIDSLDLSVEDFEFTVEIPPPLTKPMEVQDSGEHISIVMEGSNVESISDGRRQDDELPGSSMAPPTVIRQRVSLGSLSIHVLEMASTNIDASSSNKATHPILESFTYSAEVTRSSGQRFSGLETGLTVIGHPIAAETEEPNDDTHLVMHVGTAQVEALTQLGIMLLAPPGADGNVETTAQGGEPQTESDTDTGTNKVQEEDNCKSTSIVQEAGEQHNESDAASCENQSEESQNSHSSSTSQEGEAHSQLRTETIKLQEEATEDNGGSSISLEADELQSDDATAASTNNNSCTVSANEDEEPQSASNATVDEDKENTNEKESCFIPLVHNEEAVSIFVFPITSVSFVLDGTVRATFPLLVVSYQADGTMMEVTASEFILESSSPNGFVENGNVFSTSGIKIAMRPKVELVIKEVNEIHVPGVVRLTKPIENLGICFAGNTLAIDMDTIEAEVLEPE